jgi:hypothetical protein
VRDAHAAPTTAEARLDGDRVAVLGTEGGGDRGVIRRLAGPGHDRHAGLDLLRSDDALEALAAVALRPLVTGRATVVLDASLDPARRARVLEEERVRVGPAVGA